MQKKTYLMEHLIEKRASFLWLDMFIVALGLVQGHAGQLDWL